MIQKCKRNPYKDFGQVSPGLAIDIAQALSGGPIQSTGVPLQHNNISTPSQVFGKPRDIFDRLDAVDTLNEAVRASKSRQTAKDEIFKDGGSTEPADLQGGSQAGTAD